MAKVIFTDSFSRELARVEDHIFESTGDVALVERFLEEFDRVLAFLSNNPSTPSPHPITGDQSWVMADGRYRLFFRMVRGPDGETTLFMVHIIDNKQANLDVYPGNQLPTYEED